MVKVAIYENGCSGEKATRRYFIDRLLESGNELVNDPNEADCIIFQSCSGVYNAVKQLTEALTNLMIEIKGTGKELILVGCFNRVPGHCQKIKEDYPEITIIPEIEWPIPTLNYINSINEKMDYQSLLESHTMDLFFSPPFGSPANYVGIARGCNNKCTFCKGHYLDNSLHSISYNEVLEYLTQLVNNGTKRISLHADNLAQYGIDLYGVPVIHRLINDLSKLENLWRIDLYEISMQDMYPELIDEIRSNSKIRYVEMQLQTASDSLLRLMGRNHTIEEYTCVVKQLQENPNVLINTVLMSSFPTETRQDLDDTISYVAENNIFVENICRYSDSIYIPSHALGPMSDQESKEHYEYLNTSIMKNRRIWVYNNTNRVKDAMILARGKGITLFDIGIPTIWGVSKSEKFIKKPPGTIIIPKSVEPVRVAKTKNLVYKIK